MREQHGPGSLPVQGQPLPKVDDALWCRTHHCASLCCSIVLVAKAITLRLDDVDDAALRDQAEQLRVRPGTLARMLVHAGLEREVPAQGRTDARAALDRLVQRSKRYTASDAVSLVADARADFDSDP